jgi:oligopeptide/dipeptide ABC transporter ATP-binding protein
MAIANDPKLLIADEPTTALDVTIQAQILEMLADLRDQKGLAVALITHDLGVVAGLADSVCVMYAGNVVEQAGVDAVFHGPRHPYTRGLLTSLPRLDRRAADLHPIGGAPPSPGEVLPGCAYRPRCPLAVDTCDTDGPRLRPVGESDVACHRAELEVHWEYA